MLLVVLYGPVGDRALFNFHVAKLFRVKYFATLQAFDKLAVFVPGDDTYLRVFAEGWHLFKIGLDLVVFPPDCSDLLRNLEPLFVEFRAIGADFPTGWNGAAKLGL